MTTSLSTTAEEVAAWFFNEYVPTWVAAGANKGFDHESFILGYWGVPLYVNDRETNSCMMNGKAVIDFIEAHQRPLKAQGYNHTVVLDRKVTAYTKNGAGVDAIWSRRRPDESEIQRLAVHFGIAGIGNVGWRVITIQAVATTEAKLDDIWGTAD